MVDIRAGSVVEILDDNDLIDEYAKESSITGMPCISTSKETYLSLERTGSLHVLCAYSQDTLIGYIVLLVSFLPHYSARVAISESFFVAKAYRNTGAGLKLLRQAEKLACASGAVGMLVSSPVGGKLAAVLPGVGYVHTTEVFFKALHES